MYMYIYGIYIHMFMYIYVYGIYVYAHMFMPTYLCGPSNKARPEGFAYRSLLPL